MAFQLTTARLILEDLTDEDLSNIQKIAHDSDLMRYVLIWREDDEQISAFLKQAIDESILADRMG